MNELNVFDVHWATRLLPKDVRELLQEHPRRLFLAGGFIRASIAKEDISDIDLISPSQVYAATYADLLMARRNLTLDGRFTSENAITLRGSPPVQFVHRWVYDDPVKCIESFDFTIARAAIWYEDGWKSACDPDYYADLAAKRLVYLSPVREEAAGGSLLRVLKFYRKGYTIPLDSLAAVLARATSGCTGPGVEQAILGRLREVDPSLPDAEHDR